MSDQVRNPEDRFSQKEAHISSDFDNCQSSPCQNEGHCSDALDSYMCTCRPGFTGSFCETNIDDCRDHVCVNNARVLTGWLDIIVCVLTISKEHSVKSKLVRTTYFKVNRSLTKQK